MLNLYGLGCLGFRVWTGDWVLAIGVRVYWVAVKKFSLSYYIGETILATIYPLW